MGRIKIIDDEKKVKKEVIYINLIVVFLFVFKIFIFSYLTVFLALPLYFVAFGALGFSAIKSLNFGRRFFKKTGWRAFRLLALCLGTTLLIICAPLNYAETLSDFWVLLIPRQIIVHQIEEGTLKPEGCCDVSLPWWAFLLSRPSGNVRILQFRKLNIMFFDNQQILDNWSGFVYSADDQPEGAFGRPIMKLKDHWYYVVMSN